MHRNKMNKRGLIGKLLVVVFILSIVGALFVIGDMLKNYVFSDKELFSNDSSDELNSVSEAPQFSPPSLNDINFTEETNSTNSTKNEYFIVEE